MARTAVKPRPRSRATPSTSIKRAAKIKATPPVARILNCIPSANTENDWKIENALQAGVLKAKPIPPAKDLREKWWSINNQGTTGSCVGWATADSLLRWHFVKAGHLTTKELLSPRFIWMAAKETDEFKHRPTTFIETDGTSLKAALDIARRYGCVRDQVLPFKSEKLYQEETATFYVIAAQMKIASYINLGRDPNRWRRWIATKGPILARLDCDDTWMNAEKTQGRLRTYHPTTDAGHAVALVGYDPKMFIVRNSWGTSWGDDGFAYASNNYAADAFTEAYGIIL
jgi:hypothetical protein